MFNKKPLTVTRLVRRYETIRILTAIGLGLSLCVLIIFLCCPSDPWDACYYLFFGPFHTYFRTAQVVEKMQPMLITGCSFCLMMTVGNFSLINTSCSLMGPCMICAPIILNEGLFGSVPGEFGRILWITCACAGSAAVAAVVSLIPPALKRYFGCDEVITSSLLNSIFGYFCEWFVKHYLYDYSAGVMASRPYPEAARPTKVLEGSRTTTMILVGLALCVLTYIFMYHTRLGYTARVVGHNPSFARACGINTTRVSLLVSSVAGAIAGIAGTLYTLSYDTRFGGRAANMSDGMFCGIFIHSNPLLLPAVSAGLSYLRVTAETMANNTTIPVELLDVMTSFIIMLLAADQMFTKKRDAVIKREFHVTPEDREKSLSRA